MKKYLLGVFAIALAVGFSAFSSAKKTDAYFVMNSGNEFVAADRVNEANFVRADATTCESGAAHLCKIYAQIQEIDNVERPVIGTSGSLYTSLYNGGSSSLPTPDNSTVWLKP